jgi:hypothetical protein
VSDAPIVNAEIERTDLNNSANLDNSIPISAADLIQMECSPTAWIVRDVLPDPLNRGEVVPLENLSRSPQQRKAV